MWALSRRYSQIQSALHRADLLKVLNIKRKMDPTKEDLRHNYRGLLNSIAVNGVDYYYYDMHRLGEKYVRLPYSIRVLLESAIRNCDEHHVLSSDVEKIFNWEEHQKDPNGVEVSFRPARVILQDYQGVPAVVDLAAMRAAVKELKGDYKGVNPVCPTDMVIDHSVGVDFFGCPDALEKNEAMEIERNRERYTFLKWGAKAFKNMNVFPTGSGVLHQVNCEYLARVVFCSSEETELLYPDSVVGTDSHTTMVNGLGVVGWGVGGIEAEAVMMGLPMSMVLPKVVGCRLVGELSQRATTTDVALTITKRMRQHGVVGKFVEYFGPGVSNISIADRATISNMCPEYGATCAFFPIDDMTMRYLRQINHGEKTLAVIEAYLRAVGLYRNFRDSQEDPVYSEVIEIDLGSIINCVAGPKRPHDLVPLHSMKKDFQTSLTNKVGFKGYGIPEKKLSTEVPFTFNGNEYSITHGSVLIAAIASSTTASNPSALLGAGLLAKRAVKAGLHVAPYIKTSLSPASGVVPFYLKASGVMSALEELGFYVVGRGCMTCIGNSGPLPEPVSEAVDKGDLVCAGVLCGNRNYEGRIHPNLRANYLASPLLVIAYAIAGTVNIDFDVEPLGIGKNGRPVFLREIWPLRDEIRAVEKKYVVPKLFEKYYSTILNGNPGWNKLQAPEGLLYPWNQDSTYIKIPSFLQGITSNIQQIQPIVNAHCLLNLPDSVTTDHISPGGNIAKSSPAARYLTAKGVKPRDYNSYGSRRGNDAVMIRGTFANIRLVNKFMSKAGPKTIHFPSGKEMDIFDAAELYKEEGTPLVVLAGKEYGSGSSRDWAAKGPFLMGIKAVIAESFERIHRSNLVGMGILPLQYLPGQKADSLGLTGKETFTIPIAEDLKPKEEIVIKTSSGTFFTVVVRLDTAVEVSYYKNGGILPFIVRQIVAHPLK